MNFIKNPNNSMKHLKIFSLILITTCINISCFEDIDDNDIRPESINDFVWKGMNHYYVYKDGVPKLSDNEFGISAITNRYGTNKDYEDYLEGFDSPRGLFNSLKYLPETVDIFSWIVDDYFKLELQFQGISGTNGMEFSAFLAPNSTTEGYGVIKLILPDSPADDENLKRGDIFYAIDGIRLTNDNLGTLLNQETYTLNLGFYNDKGTIETTDDSIDPLNKDITISKVQYTEDPIFKTDIINVGGENVGYLMYNGFIGGSENELNTVFSDFKSNNIQHLVLDLRYNPGGSVPTTTYLASMITGQHNGDVFEKLIYNSNLQSNNTSFNFTNQLGNGTTINSLGLEKLYVLTTKRSASASEGLINGLAPYIEVVQIGTNTTGKTQASRTLYDSPNFTRESINPRHTYAMQPLIAIGVNKNDVSVPSDGLPPTIEYEEDRLNYGILGDVNEPLLALALADITNSVSKTSNIKSKTRTTTSKILMDSNDFNPFEGGMVID